MMKDTIDIQLKQNSLIVSDCEQWVACPDAGGIVSFIGTVRQKTQQKEVLKLEFEAFEPMAILEMTKIAHEAIQRFGALKVAIHHRLGMVPVSEIAVVIAVACPHRKAAFDACAYAIDTLKETVPIWKKEVFADGHVWVSSHP